MSTRAQKKRATAKLRRWRARQWGLDARWRQSVADALQAFGRGEWPDPFDAWVAQAPTRGKV